MDLMTKRTLSAGDNGPIVSGRSGFTLVEVVIASVILLMTMGALLYAFSAARQSATLSEYGLCAMQYAREEAETIRVTSWSNIAAQSLTPITNSTMLMKVGGAKIRNVITTNNYKDITLIVGWHDPRIAGVRTQVYNFVICNTN